jgi:hypothetical protein
MQLALIGTRPRTAGLEEKSPMPTANRSLLATTLCLSLAATAGCGGSGAAPTSPSATGGTGATIAGTVRSAAASAPAGLTVAVVGTGLSVAVESSGDFQLDGVPSGTVQLQFRNASVNATAQIPNVANDELVRIQVQLNGSSASILSEERSSGKVVLCHRTESGTYHSIDISVSAEATHRAHGDAKIGEPVPGDTTKVFDQNCRPVGPSVSIRKSTNGDDANSAPGPTITVGSPVTWTFEVTNDGTVALTGIVVSDDDPVVTVNCGGRAALDVGQSMTCTASGIAREGQYRNIGTVRANWSGGQVTDSDASHYLGRALNEEEGPKVQLCHRTGNGSYHLIEVSISAEPAHRAHGDGKIGEAVPGNAGRVFGAGCSVR